MQKHSENKLRFGTCSFEAHVHNVIEQNYFVWIYDVLTDPVLDVGNQSLLTFQTEYDNHVTIDDKTNSVCNLYMPKEIEIMYSEQKDDYILLNRNDEDEAIKAESSINDQIKLVNEKLAQVQKSNTRIEKLELLKYELSKYATERRDTQNTEENGIARKRRIKKKLQNLVDPNTRRKRKRGCQDDAKIVDFFIKRKKIEEEEKSGLRKKWESVYREICKMYLIDCESDINDEDYLLKMGINKNDCINELDELNTYGIIS